jgi:hypothetical protein
MLDREDRSWLSQSSSPFPGDPRRRCRSLQHVSRRRSQPCDISRRAFDEQFGDPFVDSTKRALRFGAPGRRRSRGGARAFWRPNTERGIGGGRGPGRQRRPGADQDRPTPHAVARNPTEGGDSLAAFESVSFRRRYGDRDPDGRRSARLDPVCRSVVQVGVNRPGSASLSGG